MTDRERELLIQTAQAVEKMLKNATGNYEWQHRERINLAKALEQIRVLVEIDRR